MLLRLALSAVLPLSNTSYDLLKHEVVLYYSDSCKTCPTVHEAFELAAEGSEANFYRIDCAKWPQQCRNVTLPSISAGYRGAIFYMVEKMDSAEEIATFVQMIRRTITMPYATLSQLQDSFENQGFAAYLAFTGPEQDFFEGALLQFKGKIAAGYLYGPENRITAYRNGVEVPYKGDFSRESIARFVELNKHGIFQRLTQALASATSDLKLCLLVFDPANAEQKAFARRVREQAVRITQQQALAGREFLFAHVNVRSKEFAALVQALGANAKKPIIAAVKDGRYRVHGSALEGLEEFLEDVAKGDVSLTPLARTPHDEDEL